MKKKGFILTAFFLGFMFVCGGAQAIPISYQESVHGDLDGSQELLLGSGANSVFGTIAWSQGGAVPSDWDSFDFFVLPGDTLTGILLDISI